MNNWIPASNSSSSTYKLPIRDHCCSSTYFVPTIHSRCSLSRCQTHLFKLILMHVKMSFFLRSPWFPYCHTRGNLSLFMVHIRNSPSIDPHSLTTPLLYPICVCLTHITKVHRPFGCLMYSSPLFSSLFLFISFCPFYWHLYSCLSLNPFLILTLHTFFVPKVSLSSFLSTPFCSHLSSYLAPAIPKVHSILILVPLVVSLLFCHDFHDLVPSPFLSVLPPRALFPHRNLPSFLFIMIMPGVPFSNAYANFMTSAVDDFS